MGRSQTEPERYKRNITYRDTDVRCRWIRKRPGFINVFLLSASVAERFCIAAGGNYPALMSVLVSQRDLCLFKPTRKNWLHSSSFANFIQDRLLVMFSLIVKKSAHEFKKIQNKRPHIK